MTVPLPFANYDDPDAVARGVIPWWAAAMLENMRAGGGGSVASFGPFTFADSVALAAGVPLGTLTPGRLVDVAWQVTEVFDGTGTPQVTYVGTDDVNLARVASAGTFTDPTDPVTGGTFALTDFLTAALGSFAFPCDIDNNAYASLAAAAIDQDDARQWGTGPLIVPGGALDLIARIDQGDGTPIDSATGAVTFYVVTL